MRQNCIFSSAYVDDILLVKNNMGVSSSTKARLAQQFHMKDLVKLVMHQVLDLERPKEQENSFVSSPIC